MKIICLLVFLIALSSFAQDNKGYYNTKLYFSVESTSYCPLFYSLRAIAYDLTVYNENLSRKFDKLNHGYRFSLGYVLKRNIALVMEGGIENDNIYLNPIFEVLNDGWGPSSGNYFYELKIENIATRSINYMAKIELANQYALLPLGLSHQVGIGFASTSILEKDYAYDIRSYPESALDFVPTVTNQNFYDHFYNFNTTRKIRNLTLLYAINIRTTITKKIMLNYGVRYTCNVMPKAVEEANSSIRLEEGQYQYLYSFDDMEGYVRDQKLLNLMSFNLGLTYVF